MTIAYTFAILVLFLCIHSALHRLLARWGRRRAVLPIVYLFGYPMLYTGYSAGFMVYPLSSAVLYTTGAIFVTYFCITQFLSGQTPSSVILHAYKKEPQLTEKQVYGLFSDRGLVHSRLDDLVRAGSIQLSDAGRYTVTQKGKGISKAIDIYTRVFGRKDRG